MVLNDYNGKDKALQDWEKEFLVDHRWGRLKSWFPKNHVSLDDERVTSEFTHR